MSERTVFTVKQGADHQVTLASALGDTFTATVVAELRRIPSLNSENPGTAVAATYADSTFAGDASYGPGWYLSLADTVTDDLTPGYYLVDARITYTSPSSWVQLVDPWVINIVEPATLP